jgi:hypothetical protein
VAASRKLRRLPAGKASRTARRRGFRLFLLGAGCRDGFLFPCSGDFFPTFTAAFDFFRAFTGHGGLSTQARRSLQCIAASFPLPPTSGVMAGRSDNFEQLWTILRGKIVPSRGCEFLETLVLYNFFHAARAGRGWQGSRYIALHHRIHGWIERGY